MIEGAKDAVRVRGLDIATATGVGYGKEIGFARRVSGSLAHELDDSEEEEFEFLESRREEVEVSGEQGRFKLKEGEEMEEEGEGGGDSNGFISSLHLHYCM